MLYFTRHKPNTMTIRSIIVLGLLLPLFYTASSQERVQYFTQKGKPCVADSAQEIRKGQLQQDGKWHVFTYSRTGTVPTGEAFYLDDAFLVPDGESIEYRDYTHKKIRSRGQYSQGKQTGLWLSFFDSGKPQDSTWYTAGRIRLQRSYFESGRLRATDSMDAQGNGSSTGFREDGRPEHSGQLVAWQKSGPWSYYTRAGVLCTVETMQADTIFSAMDYDAAGKNPVPHTGPFEKESDYPGGSGAWMKYLNRVMANAKLPKAFTEGRVSGTVIVQFIIDDKGMPTDIQVVQSVHPELDALVADAIRNSKGWSVAWQHNRPVRSYKKQPILFKLEAR